MGEQASFYRSSFSKSNPKEENRKIKRKGHEDHKGTYLIEAVRLCGLRGLLVYFSVLFVSSPSPNGFPLPPEHVGGTGRFQLRNGT